MDAAGHSLCAHFLAETAHVFRPPDGCLHHPFIVPGGLYSNQLWDWDTFWLVKGLRALTPAAGHEFAATLGQHALGSWMNFFANQAPNGAVPLLIEPGRSDVFDCARADGTRNQAKPVLAQLALEISALLGSTAWLEPEFDRLLHFLERWRMLYGRADGLIVWGSDLAVGIDNDPAVYGRPEFSSAGLLLNCLYAAELAAAATLARQLGREADAGRLAAAAHTVGEAVRRECWDEVDEFFYTVDVQCADHRRRYVPADFPLGMDMGWRTLPLKLKGATGFFPLWAGLATPKQAAQIVARHWRGTDTLRAAHGVRTLACNERMYAPSVESANPSNWLGPVWVVTNYIVWAGLRRYGLQAEADDLARRTRALLTNDLASTGTLHECYHPDTGSPNFNAGFLSWNTLVLLM
ncbi:MAG: hypothetical protein H3C27_10315 [Opitutaceae bacterium]|nr:hypothetical protein [Opitutaceae bacterium]